MVKPLWKIESLEKSNRKDKKLKITFLNLEWGNKIISHFGSNNSSTYLDNKDKTKKMNYIKRHSVREKHIWLDKSKFYAPSTLSLYLLWGKYTNLEDNLMLYKEHFNIA